MEMADVYAHGIHDYADERYQKYDYPEEWLEDVEKVDEWLKDNEEYMYKQMCDLILEHKKEVLKLREEQICIVEFLFVCLSDYILVADNDVAKGSSGELPMVLRHPAPAQ